MRNSYWILLIFFIVFFIKGTFIDPDFGWHLQTGNYILQHGVPTTGIFSYSMPDYPWSDLEWLTNILMALTFPQLGLTGLAFCAAIIIIVSLLLRFPIKVKWMVLPLVLTGSTIAIFGGVRVQILSWLFFSVLLSVLLNKERWRVWRNFVPLLFLVWANTHGSFPLGLITLIIVAVLRKSANRINDYSIVVISILATFINPYSMRLWQEVWMDISEPQIHFIITEWFPLLTFPFIPLLVLVVFSVVLFWKYRKKFELHEQVLYVFLLTIGVLAVRNIVYWLLFSLPITIITIKLLASDASRHLYGKERFHKAYNILLIAIICICFLQLYYSLQPTIYPDKAIAYLKNHPAKGEIFTDYNWGGYFIWQLPEKKVFIDGRMSNWRQHINNPHESDNAFREFYWVANRVESIKELTSKYHIDTLVLTPMPFSSWQQQDVDLFDVNEKKKYPEIISQLKQGGWKMVYKDNVAVIYRKFR